MEIGRGSSGTCYRAYHKTSNETYAIKKIPINNIKVYIHIKYREIMIVEI